MRAGGWTLADDLRAWAGRIGCLWPLLGAGGGVIAGLLLAGVGLLARPERLLQNPATPGLVRLPAPTPSATVVPPTEVPPTATAAPVGPVAELSVGDLVEVFGTDGDGVRLRAAPNLEGRIRGLGMDNEVFEVRDGPVEASGFSWWYLVSPYDPDREGWAVATFLRPLPGY